VLQSVPTAMCLERKTTSPVQIITLNLIILGYGLDDPIPVAALS